VIWETVLLVFQRHGQAVSDERAERSGALLRVRPGGVEAGGGNRLVSLPEDG
jgi:hypothetical protein